jgi:hypothetical protein
VDLTASEGVSFRAVPFVYPLVGTGHKADLLHFHTDDPTPTGLNIFSVCRVVHGKRHRAAGDRNEEFTPSTTTHCTGQWTDSQPRLVTPTFLCTPFPAPIEQTGASYIQ